MCSPLLMSNIIKGFILYLSIHDYVLSIHSLFIVVLKEVKSSHMEVILFFLVYLSAYTCMIFIVT